MLSERARSARFYTRQVNIREKSRMLYLACAYPGRRVTPPAVYTLSRDRISNTDPSGGVRLPLPARRPLKWGRRLAQCDLRAARGGSVTYEPLQPLWSLRVQLVEAEAARGLLMPAHVRLVGGACSVDGVPWDAGEPWCWCWLLGVANCHPLASELHLLPKGQGFPL